MGLTMRIKFTGYFTISEEDTPDERGTVDVWLLGHLKETIEAGPEIEDIYQALELSWDVV